jgi:hypothetical protein
VVVNDQGEIAFLTRLFEAEEFSKMIEVVENLVTE